MNANTKRLLKNGAIGLAVMIVVGLVPMVNALASVVGGAVAGYLQKEDVRGGAIAGAMGVTRLSVQNRWKALLESSGFRPPEW